MIDKTKWEKVNWATKPLYTSKDTESEKINCTFAAELPDDIRNLYSDREAICINGGV